MRRHWIPLIGCLAIAAGYPQAYGQEETVPPVTVTPTPADPTPAVTESVVPESPAVQLEPEATQSTGLGFLKLSGSDGFVDATQAKVRIVRRGKTILTSPLGVGGMAQIPSVASGTYTILADGSDGIAAYGIYLGTGGRMVANRIGLVPPGDAPLVRKLIRNHQEGGTADAMVTPPKPAGGSEYLEENTGFERDADGNVRGRAVLPGPANEEPESLPNLYVAFVQGGKVIDSTYTDANGNFMLSRLTPGIYSLAVAGKGGFAAYSTRVAEPENHVQARVHKLQFVSMQDAVGGAGGTVGAASSTDMGPFIASPDPNQNQNPGQTTMAPGGGGGGGTGGGGSGGGGGGGGLLGALAGAGIGAGIGAALANDNNVVTPKAP